MIESEKFRDIYVSETGRRLAAMNNVLLKLEKKPGALDLVNKLFAEMHALKSMASTMNYQKSVNLCHAVEDVLDAIRNKKIKSMDCVDILFEAVDILESNLKEISQSGKELAAMDEVVRKLEAGNTKQDRRIADGVERIEKNEDDLSAKRYTLDAGNTSDDFEKIPAYPVVT